MSLGFHLVVAMMIETSMAHRTHEPPPAPVEISRRVAVGANVRNDSPLETELPPSDNPIKDLDAGVPVKATPRPAGPMPENMRQTPKVNQPAQRTDQPKAPAIQPSNVGIPLPQNSGGQQQPNRTDAPINDGPQTSIPSDPSPPVKSGGSPAARRSRGPNRGPLPLSTEEPKVPASLAGPGVTNSVGVRVDIHSDGTSSVTIQRSSGSSEVDQIVLDALRRWKWDPAAQNNAPVDSSQTFKYVFKIG